jgi:hypothetical protein
MAITYPLSLPQTDAIRQIELRAVNTVAYSQSPFTLKGQAHAYAGEAWQADITLKPMRRSDAEQWIAFLISLRGQFGTFLLNDPLGCSARGTATSATITGSAGDRSVTVAMTGTLKAGDYFSLGTGTSTRLYKVLEDQSGSGTLEIWPALRDAASSATADLTSASGTFRLASNQQSWSINEASIYGLTFGAFEAI